MAGVASSSSSSCSSFFGVPCGGGAEEEPRRRRRRATGERSRRRRQGGGGGGGGRMVGMWVVNGFSAAFFASLERLSCIRITTHEDDLNDVVPLIHSSSTRTNKGKAED